MNYETHSRYFSEVPGEPKPKLFSPNAIALAKKFWQGAAGNAEKELKSEFRNSKLAVALAKRADEFKMTTGCFLKIINERRDYCTFLK